VVATSIPSAAFCDAHDTEGCIKHSVISVTVFQLNCCDVKVNIYYHISVTITCILDCVLVN